MAPPTLPSEHFQKLLPVGLPVLVLLLLVVLLVALVFLDALHLLTDFVLVPHVVIVLVLPYFCILHLHVLPIDILLLFSCYSLSFCSSSCSPCSCCS